MTRLNEGSDGVMIEALVTGDVGGAIRGQEARGQRAFVSSEVLPIVGTIKKAFGSEPAPREAMEALGFVFGEEVDDLFIQCRLPQGWSKAITDHSMWSVLCDDKGRKRASIFFKAAFYDRDAHMGWERRFSALERASATPESPVDWDQNGRCMVVEDQGSVIYCAATMTRPKFGDRSEAARTTFLAYDAHRESALQECQEWLDERYPDWRDPFAYWA